MLNVNSADMLPMQEMQEMQVREMQVSVASSKRISLTIVYQTYQPDGLMNLPIWCFEHISNK